MLDVAVFAGAASVTGIVDARTIARAHVSLGPPPSTIYICRFFLNSSKCAAATDVFPEPKAASWVLQPRGVRAWRRGCPLPPLPPTRSYRIMVRGKRTLSTCTILNALHIAVLASVRLPRRPNTRSFQGCLDKTACGPPAVEGSDHCRNRQCIPGSMILWCPVAQCGAPAHRPSAPPPSRLALFGTLEYVAVNLSYGVRGC